MLGGDWNSIILKTDSTKNPEAKRSPCLWHLVSAFELQYSHKLLHPRSNDYSNYYDNDRYGSEANRIDRQYKYGNISPVKSK